MDKNLITLGLLLISVLIVIFWYACKREKEDSFEDVYTRGRLTDKSKSRSYVDRDYAPGPGEYDRFLYGVPVRTDAQNTEWWVIKGFVDSLSCTCSEIEHRMQKGESLDVDADYNKWHMYYKRMRKECVTHTMFNPELRDHRPFIPTGEQLRAEKAMYDRIERTAQEARQERVRFEKVSQEILNYLDCQPEKTAKRSTIVRILAGNDEAEKKYYRSVCKRLCNRGVLKEIHPEKGGLYLKKNQKCEKRPQEAQTVEATGTVNPAMYKNIDYGTICKVRHTVGNPMDLDREKKVCRFQSLSREEVYHTSLEKCTCKAFRDGNIPCKHMISLAMTLGYVRNH